MKFRFMKSRRGGYYPNPLYSRVSFPSEDEELKDLEITLEREDNADDDSLFPEGYEPTELTREDVLEACDGDISLLAKFSIPKGVDMIGIEAFAGAENLRKVAIPEGVVMIRFGAFRECAALRKVRFPRSLKCIDNEAFQRAGLNSIRIPDSVEVIGERAFAFSEIDSARIGSGVRDVEEEAFFACKYLRKVVFPKGSVALKHLGQQAFGECRYLRKAVLPRRYNENHPYGERSGAFRGSRIRFFH